MFLRRLKFASLCAAIIVGSIAVLVFVYLWSTYINSVTTEGEAYGFSIGDSKEQTYAKVQRILPTLSTSTNAIFVETVVSDELSSLLGVNPGFTLLTQTLLHDIGFERLKDKDRWAFYFDASYFDELSLAFCNGRLCKISRQRKKFELP